MSWHNWAGDQVCRPASTARPASLSELLETVGAAPAVKVRGSGHSFSEAALTDGVMIDLGAMDRVLDVDLASGLVKVEGGIPLRQLNHALDAHGLALANLGDIDRQTISGAISTATHGTGAQLPNISAQVSEVELATGSGELVRLGANDPDGGLALRAARVGIGALGAIAAVTLRTVPAFALHRVDEPVALDRVLGDFDTFAAENDHFEFFVFPYTEQALTIRRNRTEAPLRPRSKLNVLINETLLQNQVGDWLFRLTRRFPALIPGLTKTSAWFLSEGDYIDQSFKIFSSERTIRFTEMEWAIPRASGPAAVRQVLDWIAAERYPVAFPIECRVVAADDALLSPSFERDTFYIAIHQYRKMEWRPYFEAVQTIMDEYGGRPHWGKRQMLGAAELASRYPRFGDFLAVRDRLDPNRVFANAYTERCLGP
ncbi:MAG TPA: D-arabinono-1,4-lactone oxidase [Solirubrobacteraceae bacterium]|nr:D-arabinono-1,4-lactone oxidase [Solirubrobacteraceae bacterium]